MLSEERYVVGRVMRSTGQGDQRLSVRRTRVPGADPDLAVTWGGVEGTLARLALVSQPTNEIRQGRRSVILPARAGLETSLWNVRDPCIWAMAHPVDQITFDLPRAAVADWAEDNVLGRRLLPEVASGSVIADDALRSFGLAMLPIFEGRRPANQFFVDHVLDGVCAYIAKNLSAERSPSRGGLAPWQERRAKEMMDAGSAGEISLADIAKACGLSVAHFSRAFRQSCGMSPYRWSMLRRIDKAQMLLQMTDMPLSGIAVECGFVDQSHLTNAFKKQIGSPPGAMRRYWRTQASAA